MINYKKARIDFEKDGYLIIKNFYSKKKCNFFLKKIKKYANNDFAPIMNPDREKFLISQTINKILNIKHLNKVDGGRYNRYSYNKSNITVSTEKVFEYYYNEVINLILKYPNPIIKMISKFYLKNKKKLLSLELMRYKSVCIKHAEVLAKSYHKNINLDLCIVIILIDKIPNLDSLFYDIKKIDQKYYEIIELYRMNHKEFIKKHKYIVDLISYNFKKEKVFKTK